MEKPQKGKYSWLYGLLLIAGGAKPLVTGHAIYHVAHAEGILVHIAGGIFVLAGTTIVALFISEKIKTRQTKIPKGTEKS